MRGGNSRRQAGRLRRRVGVALVVLFALRALVPTGFMLSPAALADGVVRMTLCDGYSTRSVLVDPDTLRRRWGPYYTEWDSVPGDVNAISLQNLAPERR